MQKPVKSILFFLAFLIAISINESKSVKNLKEETCGGLSTILYTFVDECKGDEDRCEVPIGANHEIGITFVTSDTTSVVSLIEVWFYYPFGSVNKITSEEYTEGVTLSPETEYKFFVSATIPDRHLGREGELAVILHGSESERIACGEVPVVITNSTLLH